ncbi:MAG: ATP-dependent Clp protease ATP-binding subunit, partial [Oscillospiraceae bacterium]
MTKIDMNGNQQNEGYCLTCARELNLGPVDNIMQQMGIDPEEMDSLNSEMGKMLEEMDGDFNPMEAMKMLQADMPQDAELDEDEDEDEEIEGEEIEDMSRSMQKNPFDFMNKIFNSNSAPNSKPNDDLPKDTSTEKPKKKVKDKTKKKKKFLDMYGVNLTAKARAGEIDAVIGRDVEMQRTAQILNRRTKNNPCLIGEPGVGKTAIAEGLALKIATGNVPAKLLGYEIYLLDMTAVVAGTQFRGQFESRLKNIIEEVKKTGNIILVIDEIHTIVSAGDAEGGMNAGNILKPALSRGDIQVIGATTIEEYRKHIEKDTALERRFQTIMVEEPTVEETINIIKGIKNYYEEYHKVTITDEIIRTATILADRYIQDRFMPDKAIDVIDEAASKANLENLVLVDLQKLKNERTHLQSEIDAMIGEDDVEDRDAYFQKSADLKSNLCRVNEKIAELEKTNMIVDLTVEDIATVIENWTRIPVKHISEYETNKLIGLEERLHERLIGQDAAVDAVSRGIRRKRAGISLKRRPASFIFVGPTGVGKTELVKRI